MGGPDKSLDARKNRSLGQRRRYQNPLERALQAARLTAYMADPEHRAQRSRETLAGLAAAQIGSTDAL